LQRNQQRVDILGASFIVGAEESKEYLHRVVEYLRYKVSRVAESVSSSDPLKIALLAALNIADEFFKEREKHAPSLEDHDEMTEIAERMIGRIDQCLIEESMSP
jgi:cell division protein ZapA